MLLYICSSLFFVEISVGESHTDPSPSNSDKKDEQMPNSRIGDTEIKRTLRYLATDQNHDVLKFPLQ
jgi:hypothetical protein